MRKRTRNRNSIAAARWRRSQIAETFASVRVSAPCYRLPKDVWFVAIVESETELRKVQRLIFLADIVVGADDPALQQRPERFHRVRVNESAHVFAAAMIYSFVRKFLPSCEVLIAGVLISRDQFNLILVHDTINETVHRRHIGVLDHLTDHVAFAGNRTDDRNLVAGSANVTLLVPMAIGVPAAHVGFVDFDDPHQLPELRIVHRSPQAMAHIEGCAVGTGFNHPMDLKRADSFFASEDQEQHPKPSPERVFGVLENRSRDEREPIGVPLAAILIRAFPLPRQGDFVNGFALATARAFHALRPAVREQIVLASFLIGENPLELRPRHLHRELRLMLFALRLHGKTNIAQIYLSVKYRILAFFYGRGGRPHGGR